MPCRGFACGLASQGAARRTLGPARWLHHFPDPPILSTSLPCRRGLAAAGTAAVGGGPGRAPPGGERRALHPPCVLRDAAAGAGQQRGGAVGQARVPLPRSVGMPWRGASWQGAPRLGLVAPQPRSLRSCGDMRGDRQPMVGAPTLTVLLAPPRPPSCSSGACVSSCSPGWPRAAPCGTTPTT